MLAIVMMTSTIIFAQHAKNSHKGHTDRFEKMKTDLALTDAQYASIKSIDTKYNSKREALKNDSAQTREAKGTAFKTMRTEEENEITALLTTDQKTKWDKLKAERGEKRKEHFQKISEQREAKLKSTLGLSDDQSQKIKTVNQQFMEKFSTLRKSDTKDKAAFEKLKTDHETAIKGILTPEQFQKWTAMKTDMRKKHDHDREHKHTQKG